MRQMLYSVACHHFLPMPEHDQPYNQLQAPRHRPASASRSSPWCRCRASPFGKVIISPGQLASARRCASWQLKDAVTWSTLACSGCTPRPVQQLPAPEYHANRGNQLPFWRSLCNLSVASFGFSLSTVTRQATNETNKFSIARRYSPSSPSSAAALTALGS